LRHPAVGLGVTDDASAIHQPVHHVEVRADRDRVHECRVVPTRVVDRDSILQRHARRRFGQLAHVAQYGLHPYIDRRRPRIIHKRCENSFVDAESRGDPRVHAEAVTAAVHSGDISRDQLALAESKGRRSAHQPLAVRTEDLEQIGV
jgi:hypothetical protein